MVDRDLLLEKLPNLRRCLERVQPRLRMAPDHFLKDLDARDVVFHNLELAAQACVDAGAHILADEGWGVAGKQVEIFEILVQHGVIPPAVGDGMIDLVRFRNELVHTYAKVNIVREFRALPGRVKTLVGFGQAVTGRFRLGGRRTRR